MKLTVLTNQDLYTILDSAKEQDWNFPKELTDLIYSYHSPLEETWRNIFSYAETVKLKLLEDVQREKFSTPNEFLEQALQRSKHKFQWFKEIFLEVLTNLCTFPDKPLTLTFNRYSYDGSIYSVTEKFETAGSAMDLLINTGINLSEKDREFNIWFYLERFKLLDDPDISQALKEVFLKLPGSKEFILKDREKSILFHLKPTTSQYDEIDFLRNSSEPRFYFYETPTKLDIVALQENKTTINILENHLPQFLKDEDEILQRVAQKIAINIDNLYLFPYSDDKNKSITDIIGKYAADENFFINLASSILRNLKDYKKIYQERFEEFKALPDVLENTEKGLKSIAQNSSVSCSWVGREHYDAFSTLDQYEYKGIKVIEKLIKGVTIQYGSRGKARERFLDYGPAIPFYLLKFFKDLSVASPNDSSIDIVIRELLELTNTHCLIRVNKSMLAQAHPECATVSQLEKQSLMATRMIAEKELNNIFKNEHKEEYPINFIIVPNSDELDCFVKLSALKTSAELRKYQFSTLYASPFYIYGFLKHMQLLGVWADYDLQKRSDEICKFISERYQISIEAVPFAGFFHNNGYKIKVLSESVNNIKRQNLFLDYEDAKLPHPAQDILKKSINPIKFKVKTLIDNPEFSSYVAHLSSFVIKFEASYDKEFKQIKNEIIALGDSISFLKEWQSELGSLSMILASLSSTSPKPTNLDEDLSQTEQNMRNAQTVIEELLEKLTSGEFSHLLHHHP